MALWLLTLTLFMNGEEQSMVLKGPFTSQESCMEVARFEAEEGPNGVAQYRLNGIKVDGFALTCKAPGYEA